MDKIKLYNDLPLYEAKMNEEDTGVYCVSFVSNPATEIGWVTFADEKQIQKFAIEDSKEHIVSGIIMVANTPIYRIDGNGFPYYIVYSKETLKYMAEKMIKDGFTSSVNIQHQDGSNVDGVNLMEIYVIDKEKGICPSYFSEVPDGSLVGTYKVRNDEVWEMIEGGEVLSFSLEGIFDIEPVLDNNKVKKNSTMSLIEKFMKKLVKFSEISTDKGILLIQDGEEFAVGTEVYIEVEGEWVAAEDGEYKLEDGKVVSILEGKIAEIKDPEEIEEPAEEKPAEEVEAAEEEEIVVEEEPVEPTPEERDDKQEQIDALKAEIAGLREEIEGLKNSLAEIVQQPIVEPVTEEFEQVKNESENQYGKNKAAKLFSHLK